MTQQDTYYDVNPNSIDISWHDKAKCSGQPGEYDARKDMSAKGYRGMLANVRSLEKCEGCPVIQQCAAQALQERWEGVVSAGVELPYHKWFTSSRARSNHKNYLTAVAGGRGMHDALAEYFGGGHFRWRFSLIVALRGRYIEMTGRIPSPTHEATVIPPQVEHRSPKYIKQEHERITTEIMALPPVDEAGAGRV